MLRSHALPLRCRTPWLSARGGRLRPVFDPDLAEFRAEFVRTTLGAALRRRPGAAPLARALCLLRHYLLTGPSFSHLSLPQTPQRSRSQTSRVMLATESCDCTGVVDISSTNSTRIGSRGGNPRGGRQRSQPISDGPFRSQARASRMRTHQKVRARQSSSFLHRFPREARIPSFRVKRYL